MMRLPLFQYRAARTLNEAAEWLAAAPGETMLVAGGTDVLPNMKRRQQEPRTLIGLRAIPELSTMTLDSGLPTPDSPPSRPDTSASARPRRSSPDFSRAEAGRFPTPDPDRPGLRIGAGVTLTRLVRNESVQRHYTGLWQAAAQIATPHLRNMGTVGGNLCLDTRCNYYDQSYEWRKSIDFCMKKDGGICWVATSSPKCLAVSSTDTAPMLQALDARVRLVSASGERWMSVADLYQNDGMHYLTRRPDEILAEIDVPDRTSWRTTYWKLRRRGSFDFPVLSVAAAVKLTADGVVDDARIVLGAVASRPLSAPAAENVLRGVPLTNDAIAAAADAAYTIAKPMDNTDFELVWRKKMSRTLVTYALRELRGDDTRELRRKLARQELIAVG